MIVDYSKLNQGLTPVTAAEPDVVSLLEQIDTLSSTWYSHVDLENSLFSIPVHKD